MVNNPQNNGSINGSVLQATIKFQQKVLRAKKVLISSDRLIQAKKFHRKTLQHSIVHSFSSLDSKITAPPF